MAGCTGNKTGLDHRGFGCTVPGRLPARRKRYLNESHFVSRTNYHNQFAERPVDKHIKQDQDLYYRVLDLTGSTFMDATASYHHKSVGDTMQPN